MQNHIISSLEDAYKTLSIFLSDKKNIELVSDAISLLTESYKKDGKSISCGNGGSMCDSMHFAEELTGRFRKERDPLPAMAISDPSHISCVSNDYGYEYIFSRQIQAFGKDQDVLIAISTSGNSQNVINAVNVAKEKNMKVIGLLGKNGGKLRSMVDVPIIVPNDSSDRIQEVHIKIIHILIEGVERNLFPENY